MNRAEKTKYFKISVVILNYLNYKDTIDCVESVLLQKYPIQRIIIIDNGSYNDSVFQLKEQYKRNHKIKIISLNKNLGFAKGNNVGIRYATEKEKADFVLAVNNDTKLVDENYLDILVKYYDKSVGIIGSRIRLKNGNIQSEIKRILDLKQCVLVYLNLFSTIKGSCFDFVVDRSDKIRILHGCSLLFTPSFFKYYKGFYPRTFLYHEEEILYLMCRNKGLIQKYILDTEIFHKEDQSSKLSFDNNDFVKKRYECQSYKYVIYWLIKFKLFGKKVE